MAEESAIQYLQRRLGDRGSEEAFQRFATDVIRGIELHLGAPRPDLSHSLSTVYVSREWMDAAKRILHYEDDPDGDIIINGVAVQVHETVHGFEHRLYFA